MKCIFISRQTSGGLAVSIGVASLPLGASFPGVAAGRGGCLVPLGTEDPRVNTAAQGKDIMAEQAKKSNNWLKLCRLILDLEDKKLPIYNI